ncbi:MAG: enoyl-CoA hydratase [Betaproteobacteria bacterium]|nr:enoyl-CoA hydratase [Betaproteobacteria bacterium]NBX96777.1 enoyl-CoA hydratase [Betaproteobacteria bacterium]
MSTELLAERRDATLVLTLSDPATRNALSREVYARGAEWMQQASHDASVRAVILRGEGDTFCAGGNLQRILGVRSMGETEGRLFQADSINLLTNWVKAISMCPKPVIAAVEGFAAGAGASLALACDLLVAAEDAKLVMSYSRIGFSPDGGGSWQLARFLPRQLALKALWLASPLTPADLHTHGLVTQIAPKGKTLDEALGLAAQLAKLAPNAVASVKKLAQLALAQDLAAQLDTERDHFVDNLFHPNGQEGPTAFLEKRNPCFR